MPEVFDASKKKRSFVELEKLVDSGRFRSQLGSLMVSPKDVKYQDLDEDEEIVLLGRRHFITNVGWIFTSCVLLFVPLIWGEFPFFSALTDNVHLATAILWYLSICLFVTYNMLMWFYNVYILTNERLISCEFFGLMNKTINVTQINRIEDVSYQQKGILSSIFDYGDVIAETASDQRTADVAEGELSSFTFEKVGNPNDVVRIISELMEIVEKDNLEAIRN